MHRATASTSSSTSSSHRSRRRQLTRDQLLKGLQILGPVSAPLPPELPPSPPASRESSPAPGLKRRHDSESEHGRNKKPRLSSATTSRLRATSQSHPSSAATATTVASSSRHEPAEDGEVKEEPQAGPSGMPSSLSFMPVRRPRRGDTNRTSEWDSVYEKCFAKARALRFSSLSRVAAAHPATSKEYRPLRNPPNPNSSYAKDPLLMARLELIDSLLHFVYGLWCKDYSARTCYRAAWRTVNDFLQPTKKKLIAESHDDREKAFIGLLFTLDAYIHGRKLKYQATAIDKENDSKMNRLNIEWKAEKAKAQARAAAAAQASMSSATPNMLPSPASSNSANSSNSTPLGGHGTPGHNPAMDLGAQPDAGHSSGGADRPMAAPPPHLQIPVSTQFVVDRKSQSSGLLLSSHYLQTAQQSLNLPVMAKHFPRTLARMMFSTLSPQDEHEPDFQDDDCELFWPPQAITGEGLGWVCLMGMAMVKEFGKEYGYQGVDGVVQKQGSEDVNGFPEPRFVPHTR